MPIYEYRCQDCEHEFERMQKFSDPPVANCPTCAGPVRKLISRSAFHLKGDGWYVTDYARKGNSQNQNENGKSSADDRNTTGDSSSKTSPATEDKGSSTGKGTSTDTGASTTSAVDTASS